MPPENLQQIFNPFFSSKGSRGTGLGLAVSQKILKEHGGRILVESRPGEGSRFVLELPAMPVEEQSAVQGSDGVGDRQEAGREVARNEGGDAPGQRWGAQTKKRNRPRRFPNARTNDAMLV